MPLDPHLSRALWAENVQLRRELDQLREAFAHTPVTDLKEQLNFHKQQLALLHMDDAERVDLAGRLVSTLEENKELKVFRGGLQGRNTYTRRCCSTPTFLFAIPR